MKQQLEGLFAFTPEADFISEERFTPYQAARHPFFASYLPLGFLLLPDEGKITHLID